MEMWRLAVSGPGEEKASVVISQKAASSSSVVAVDGGWCLSPSAIIPVPDSPFNYPVLFRTQSATPFLSLEVIPDNWTQKFEPHGGQISKP